MSLTQRIFGAGEPEPEPTHPDPATLRMPVPIDEMLTIAKNERRRVALRTVANADGDVLDIGTVANKVAAHECNKPVGLLSSKERKKAYVGLYQSHLPKLDEWGLLKADDRNTQIATTPLTDDAAAYLDVLDAMHGEVADE